MSDAPDWTVPLTIVDGATMPGADFPDWLLAVSVDGAPPGGSIFDIVAAVTLVTYAAGPPDFSVTDQGVMASTMTGGAGPSVYADTGPYSPDTGCDATHTAAFIVSLWSATSQTLNLTITFTASAQGGDNLSVGGSPIPVAITIPSGAGFAGQYLCTAADMGGPASSAVFDFGSGGNGDGFTAPAGPGSFRFNLTMTAA